MAWYWVLLTVVGAIALLGIGAVIGIGWLGYQMFKGW